MDEAPVLLYDALERPATNSAATPELLATYTLRQLETR